MRTTNTTDAQKIVDTLYEFCPGMDGGSLNNKRSDMTQSISRTQTSSTPQTDQFALLTESQMGGRADWQQNDSVTTQQVSPSALHCPSETMLTSLHAMLRSDTTCKDLWTKTDSENPLLLLSSDKGGRTKWIRKMISIDVCARVSKGTDL